MAPKRALTAATTTATTVQLMAAAEALPRAISDEDAAAGLAYPKLKDIRAISTMLAAEVIKAAAAEGLKIGKEAAVHLAAGDEALMRWIQSRMFVPTYASLAYKPQRGTVE